MHGQRRMQRGNSGGFDPSFPRAPGAGRSRHECRARGTSGVTKPTATGNLTSSPFCELLVYALGQSLSGSLVLECPDRSKHAVTFQVGAPVKARVNSAQLRIGELLVARGSLDPALAEEVAREASEADAGLYGARLLARGALDPKTLSAALDEQLYEQLGWLARAPSATAFAYFADVDLLASWGGEGRLLDPLACIWQAVQSNAPKERLSQACQALGEKMLRLHPASRIGRFGFGNRERPVLDVLRMKPQTFAELSATALLEPAALERLLYVLTLTRHLDTGVPPLGVNTATRPVIAAITPRRRAASSAQLPKAVAVAEDTPAPNGPPPRRELTQTGRFASRQEIEAKHGQLDQLNYYQLLDLDPAVSTEQIAVAFSALVRRWHPDRLSPELSDLKDVSMRVFARMTEAHRTLAHANTREEYDRSLGGESVEDSEQAQVVRVLRAAEAFQKAEILMRKRDLDGAERFASVAIAGDKDQPEYAALYAWIRARKSGATEADIANSLEVLKGAVAKQDNNVKMRYYLAGVLKLSGHTAAALREFRFVADNDPSNLDAARELRLHDIRRNNAPDAAPKEGLFGRLFKR
jgi:curved DNA-binding protein CbpA